MPTPVPELARQGPMEPSRIPVVTATVRDQARAERGQVSPPGRQGADTREGAAHLRGGSQGVMAGVPTGRVFLVDAAEHATGFAWVPNWLHISAYSNLSRILAKDHHYQECRRRLAAATAEANDARRALAYATAGEQAAREELVQARGSLASVTAERERAKEELVGTRQALESVTRDRDVKQQQLEAALARVDQLASAIREVEEARNELAETKESLASVTAERDGLQCDLVSVHEELERAKLELASPNEPLVLLIKKLELVTGERQEMAEKLAVVIGAEKAAREQLASVTAAEKAAREQLASVTAADKVAREQLASANANIAALEGGRHGLEAERDELRTLLASMNEELASVSGDLASLQAELSGKEAVYLQAKQETASLQAELDAAQAQFLQLQDALTTADASSKVKSQEGGSGSGMAEDTAEDVAEVMAEDMAEDVAEVMAEDMAEDMVTGNSSGVCRARSGGGSTTGAVGGNPPCFAFSMKYDNRASMRASIEKLNGTLEAESDTFDPATTHLITEVPLRSSEKLLASMAAGLWILKPNYVIKSAQMAELWAESAYECNAGRGGGGGAHMNGTGARGGYVGSVDPCAPRYWRTRRQIKGVGAFHGTKAILFGDMGGVEGEHTSAGGGAGGGNAGLPPVTSSQDDLQVSWLERVITAGGGEVLATAPPYAPKVLAAANVVVIGRARVDVNDGVVNENGVSNRNGSVIEKDVDGMIDQKNEGTGGFGSNAPNKDIGQPAHPQHGGAYEDASENGAGGRATQRKTKEAKMAAQRPMHGNGVGANRPDQAPCIGGVSSQPSRVGNGWVKHHVKLGGDRCRLEAERDEAKGMLVTVTQLINTGIDDKLRRLEELQQQVESLKVDVSEARQKEEKVRAERDAAVAASARAGGALEELRGQLKAANRAAEELLRDMVQQREEVSQLQRRVAESEEARNAALAEVDRVTKKFDTELTCLREQHEEQVMFFMREHEVKIQNLTDQHNAEVQRLTDSHNGIVRSLTEQHALEVEHLTDKHNAEVQRLTDSHNGIVRSLTEQHALEVEHLTDKHNAEVQRLTDKHAAEVECLNNEHREEVEHLTQQHVAEVERLNNEHRTENNEHTAEVERLNNEHAAEVEHLFNEHTAEVECLNNEHATEVKRLKREHKEEVEQITEQHKGEMDEKSARVRSITQLHEAEVESLAEQHALEVAHLTAQHVAEVERLADNHVAEINKREAEVQRLVCEHAAKFEHFVMERAAEVERLVNERAAEVERLVNERAAEVERLLNECAAEVELLVNAHAEERERLKEQHDSNVSCLKSNLEKAEAELEEVDKEWQALKQLLRELNHIMARHVHYIQPCAELVRMYKKVQYVLQVIDEGGSLAHVESNVSYSPISQSPFSTPPRRM
eukprot:jgi/Mesvir1/7494/Mv19254-RA.1